MALQIEDLGSRWETFFEEVKLQEIQLLTNNSIEFRIRFNDIQSWDPEFAKRILEEPNRLIKIGEKPNIAARKISEETGYKKKWLYSKLHKKLDK